MLSYLDLARAYDFVNFSDGHSHHAFIHTETGEIRLVSDLDPELFAPWDDALLEPPWIELPAAPRLDGPEQHLPLEFLGYVKPHERRHVAEFFRYRGGMQRFIAWLEVHQLDELWRSYQLSHQESLLRQWCHAHDIQIDD